MTNATTKDMRDHIPWHQKIFMEKDAKIKALEEQLETARNAQKPLVLENKKLRRVISHVADSMKHTPHMDANEFSLLQWLLEKSIEEQK